ncbi:MAG: hypothetical protein NEA02_16850, partial [Thermoanaerobaculia bacterium]|nr:hypothetical protein [Thermoanaerobaculia bacterium]
WARAWLMEKGQLPPGLLKVVGGEIEVRAEELPDGGLRVLSTGRVRAGEATLAARREVTIFAASERRR